jgi:hypothetical protein
VSKNLSESSVATPPTPALSGLTLTVQAGHGSRFLPGPMIVWPANVDPSPDNAEVVTVLSVSGDVLTLNARAAESSTARAIQVGWQVAQGLTAGTWDAVLARLAALEALVQELIETGGGGGGGGGAQNIDGGTPSSSFTGPGIDGGAPGTTTFSSTIDGGTP